MNKFIFNFRLQIFKFTHICKYSNIKKFNDDINNEITTTKLFDDDDIFKNLYENHI